MTEMKLPKKVAILYSEAKREYFTTEQLYISEVEVKERAELVAKYFEKMGIEITLFPGNKELVENLKNFQPDFVLNLVDSVFGKEDLAAAVPGTLELLGIPYTGAGMAGLTIGADKYMTKQTLSEYGISVPNCQLFSDPNQEIDKELKFPVFSKLNESHGSIEIDETAVSADETALRKRLLYLIETYKQPILVEEYIAGREITVMVFEGEELEVYTGEKIFGKPFDGKFNIVTFEANWDDDSEASNAITYNKYEMPQDTKEMLKKAYRILKMKSYGKFDIRLDKEGTHFITDANHNPTFGPKEIGCAMGSISSMHGVSFEEIINKVITSTMK